MLPAIDAVGTCRRVNADEITVIFMVALASGNTLLVAALNDESYRLGELP